MNAEKPEIFRGHWKECLEHLSNLFSKHVKIGSKGAGKKKKPMALFCGVNEKRIAIWFSGKESPEGLTLLRLMCYMDLLGYRVIELERMPAGKRGFAELLGYGIITLEDAVKLLGYSTASGLFRVIYDQSGASEEKELKMWDAWKENRDRLEAEKFKAASLYLLEFIVHYAQHKLVDEITDSLPQVRIKPDIGTLQIMEGLSRLIDSGSLDELTENQGVTEPAMDIINKLMEGLNSVKIKLTERDQKVRIDG